MCLPDLQYDHTLEISSTFPSPSTSSAASMDSGPAIRPTSPVHRLWEEEYLDNLAECKGEPIVTPRR
jgi:hypothetical protein